MKIFDQLSLELIFFIIVGAAVFVSGTTKLRTQRKQKKRGHIWNGTVLQTKYITKKNEAGNLIQNYYELRIEYKKENHKKQVTVKSIREFVKGDRVKLLDTGEPQEEVRLYEHTEASVLTAWFLIILGMLTMVLPIVNNTYGTVSGSAVLAMMLMILGFYFVFGYIKDRRRKIVPIKAEVVDLLYWKRGKEKSRFAKPVVSYYPILSFEWKGQLCHMRSHYNYNSENSCQVGSERTLYYDEINECLLERSAKKSMLVWGSLFLIVAVIGIMNVFYML